MKSELIIRSNSADIDYALLKDGKLNELHKESNGVKFSVGDVFYAKIRKIIPSLNAAFVDVGYEKDAFLHYHDLGPQLQSLLNFQNRLITGKQKDFTLKNFRCQPDINKDGEISEILKAGQKLLVQIVKEPISTKGPRISSEISIAGRFLVIVPFSERVSVSQKIESSKEKERLKRLAKSIKPKGFGIILRTVAKGKKVAELDKDLQNSLKRWYAMCKVVKTAKPRAKVLSELNRGASILRDIFNDSFTNIVVNNEDLYLSLKEYIGRIAPDKESIVKLYQSDIPIFEKYGIERQIKAAFGRTVSMVKGAYLVIEHTEALHVIDVNSGNRAGKGSSQEDAAFEVNLIAANEIARQLQLRDLGGIIVVDFIDMLNPEHRKKLFEHLKAQMKFDRTKHKILPPSKFGLIQITRQRVRPELDIETREPNPNQNGKVEAPIVLIDKIENELEQIVHKKIQPNGIILHVHPFVAAYLNKGLPSIKQQWIMKYKKWIKVLPRDAYQYLEYRFKDKQSKKIVF